MEGLETHCEEGQFVFLLRSSFYRWSDFFFKTIENNDKKIPKHRFTSASHREDMHVGPAPVASVGRVTIKHSTSSRAGLLWELQDNILKHSSALPTTSRMGFYQWHPPWLRTCRDNGGTCTLILRACFWSLILPLACHLPASFSISHFPGEPNYSLLFPGLVQ